jgi:signal transduction histidine kinase
MSKQQRLILGLTLRQHIGGRWAISVISVLLVTPLGIAASGANVASVQGTQSIGQWLILGLAGSAVIIAVLVVANFTAFRNRRVHPVPIWWVVALGVIAGAARSVVVVPLSAELGVIDFSWQEMTIRMISGGAIGAIFLPLGALLSSVIASYVTQRRELLHELSDLEVERMRASGESEVLRAAVLDELRAEMGDLVETGDPQAARAGVLPAIGQLLFSIACIAVAFWAGRKLSSRFPNVSIGILIAVVVFIEATVGLLAALLFQRDPLVDNSAAMLANAIWMPVLIFMAGAVVSAIRSGDDVLRQLRERVSATQARTSAQEAETARIRKEVAAALHGTVQSQLLASAAGLHQPRIAELMTRSPQEGLEAALSSIDAATASTLDIGERLERIERSWGSLMQVTITGVEYAQGSGHEKSVIRVVEEALANAYRHGHAGIVDVSIAMNGNTVMIRVVDDGDGLPAEVRPGLGSAVLESLAPGAWSLTEVPEGHTMLSVELRDSQT